MECQIGLSLQARRGSRMAEQYPERRRPQRLHPKDYATILRLSTRKILVGGQTWHRRTRALVTARLGANPQARQVRTNTPSHRVWDSTLRRATGANRHLYNDQLNRTSSPSGPPQSARTSGPWQRPIRPMPNYSVKASSLHQSSLDTSPGPGLNRRWKSTIKRSQHQVSEATGQTERIVGTRERPLGLVKL
jgi:hypothetical protein